MADSTATNSNDAGTGSAKPTDALRDGGRKAGDAIRKEALGLKQQATEKARAYADDGKSIASDKLDEVARLIGEAADTVDDRVGEQYGAYARSAADVVTNFAEQLRGKDVEELVEDARAFVQKSPAVAIGTAAAIGFVLARLLRAGVEPAGTGRAGARADGEADVVVDFDDDGLKPTAAGRA